MTEQELKTAAWDYRMTFGYPETQEEMEKMAECFWELGFRDGESCGLNSVETM